MEFLTKSEKETKKLGEKIAKLIISKKLKKRILTLEGDLGTGKTTFLKGFAKGLKIRERILSPTFVILKKFKIKNSKFKNFYHIDCFRIKKPKEILDLGFKKIISDPQNIVAIEWAEKIKKILSQKTLSLKFHYLNKNERKIVIKNDNIVKLKGFR